MKKPIVLFCLFFISDMQMAMHFAEEVRQNNKWDFVITEVQECDITRLDAVMHPTAVVKWCVTTKLVMLEGPPRYLLTMPAYGATVNGEIDSAIFLGGSHLPLKSRDNDFIYLKKGDLLIAKHFVFATKTEKGYLLEGAFAENLNVEEEKRSNNFSWPWKLSDTPVENEFSLSICLFDRYFDAQEVLGDDFTKLFRGKIKTPSVSIKINH
jgi:hypothetical protein